MEPHADLGPLAERMRPRSLDDYIGQAHLVGPDALLRRAHRAGGQLPSMVLWGPPGVGKTSLARILAEATGKPFFQLSAIHSGVKDVRDAIAAARPKGLFAGRAILFIDEIHRFSKAQQDSLLAAVEQGWVTLIGATTENPSFEVIPALLSRCQTYTLQPLTEDDMRLLVQRVCERDVIWSQHRVEVDAWTALLRAAGGDARRLLNVLELVLEAQRDGAPPEATLHVTDAGVMAAVQTFSIRHDRAGDAHYDLLSALIKSIRASDPHAAVYYLARLIAGGEDAKVIARRLVISASEDVGLANPTALVLATATFQAVERIGMPEGRIVLSECVIYLASSAKGNGAYRAIDAALAEVQRTGELPVPMALRNAPTRLMEEQGYGAGYRYDHDFPGAFSGQECMPEALVGRRFFEPGGSPREQALASEVARLWGGKYGAGEEK